jgi:hypothetical protein
MLQFKGLWLYFAYELEFNGVNTFKQLWISGLVFLAANCYIMKSGFIDTYEFKQKAE